MIAVNKQLMDVKYEESLEAYELKLRVTIAASGQGRFGEEMSFPIEAKRAGIIPVLIVFAPTPSALLERLKSQYIKHGGRCAISVDAWNELISKAGKEMGIFIQKYIEQPILNMGNQSDRIPSAISLVADDAAVKITDSLGNKYEIDRCFINE